MPCVEIVAMKSAEFRKYFPTLKDNVHLASCSLTARSTELDKALTRMLAAMANQGAPWQQFEEELNIVRRRFAALIGAEPEQIAILPNASIGAYQVASTLRWEQREKVITTEAEFPSIAHIWLAQRSRGADVIYVSEHKDTAEIKTDYLSAIDDRTRLVSIPYTTYLNSTRFPVTEVCKAAHMAGARVFVDAYQAVGVEPIDVNALECDYLVAGTMKYLLGLPGLAFLYVRSGVHGDQDPQLTGWFGRTNPFAFDPHQLDFPNEARRYETGTPAVPAVYAANAGLELIGHLDLHAVKQHVTALLSYACEQLRLQGEQLHIAKDPLARGAHLALVEQNPEQLSAFLAEQHIAISPRGQIARLSFHYYNTKEDVDIVCKYIGQYRTNGRRNNTTRSTKASSW